MTYTLVIWNKKVAKQENRFFVHSPTQGVVKFESKAYNAPIVCVKDSDKIHKMIPLAEFIERI